MKDGTRTKLLLTSESDSWPAAPYNLQSTCIAAYWRQLTTCGHPLPALTHSLTPSAVCWHTTASDCKGVRCPPIFSLSNLINAGWLVRKCVDIIYIHPLITGTNRKAFCCMLALRWRTITASDHQLLILLKSNNWCLNVTYLWIGNNGFSAGHVTLFGVGWPFEYWW